MSIFCVYEQQAVWLFASKNEALDFNRSRSEEHRWSKVSPFDGRPFSPRDSNRPTEPGPGQERCRRIQRHCRKWWQAYDAWNKAGGLSNSDFA
jgi:hypothetical protein